jgi:hypothetical protein
MPTILGSREEKETIKKKKKKRKTFSQGAFIPWRSR